MVEWVLDAPDALQQVGVGLDELHRSCGVPVTARRPWLQAWVEAYDEYRPLVVGVGDRGGRIDAAAVLATRRRRGGSEVVACGHGPSDAVMLPARDHAAAEALASTIEAELGRRGRTWRMTVRHLVPDDPVAVRLAARLRRAQLSSGDVSPRLCVEPGASLRTQVSSSHHRGISRIRNRMVREGLEPRIAHLRTSAEVAAVLAQMEDVYRRRDLDVGRRPALDVPAHRAFFRRVVERHAELGELCVTVLELEGRLAAYTLCFVDGAAFRMWNCRFDPAWARFSPGKLAMDESVAHALDTGATEYDFMRGAEPYKDSYANSYPVLTDLYAASGPWQAAATSAYLSARSWARRQDESGSRAGRLVTMTREARQRWGR
jgi:CelD/BcsL family acetyltransferase involved in cellulose biosynthesis